MPQDEESVNNLTNRNTKSPNKLEMPLDKKIEEVVKLYEEYENEVTRLYEDFVKKVADVRKKDDLKKLENM